ncbi:hypothetical protein TrLO_g11836 [Triparma laevis f. longispina]|uniref:Uncharacterized protein n=1 Tax=Triparma laevis f. longispina TaxID=1714387 RepID=A0A9W7FQE5_9STRA|nr:hypothetical protein TrLO_g11836 [Triparma laevis f. longispina]
MSTLSPAPTPKATDSYECTLKHVSKGSKGAKGAKGSMQLAVILDTCKTVGDFMVMVEPEIATFTEVQVTNTPGSGAPMVSFPVSTMSQIVDGFIVKTSYGPCTVDATLLNPFTMPSTIPLTPSGEPDYFSWWMSDPDHKYMMEPQPTTIMPAMEAEVEYSPMFEYSPECPQFINNTAGPGPGGPGGTGGPKLPPGVKGAKGAKAPPPKKGTKVSTIAASASAPLVLAGILAAVLTKKSRSRPAPSSGDSTMSPGDSVKSPQGDPDVEETDSGKNAVEVDVFDNERLQRKQSALRRLSEKHKRMTKKRRTVSPDRVNLTQNPSSTAPTFMSPMSPASDVALIYGSAAKTPDILSDLIQSTYNGTTATTGNGTVVDSKDQGGGVIVERLSDVSL